MSEPKEFWIDLSNRIQLGYGYSSNDTEWKYTAYGKPEYWHGQPFKFGAPILHVVEKSYAEALEQKLVISKTALTEISQGVAIILDAYPDKNEVAIGVATEMVKILNGALKGLEE